MVIPPSARALRRPKVYVSVLLFFTFVLAIGHVNRNSRSPISFNPFAKQPSPYYTQDESKYYTWKTPSFFPPLKDTRGDKKTDFCTGFPTHLLDRIQVVVKTGTGESAKNKAHTASVTSCIENLLVFSDLEEKVGDRNFIDVLADLPQSYNDIPDFATYATQKQAHEQGDAVGYSSEGWRLDRFKFLPMVERAYKMNPDADWYVFIETDVYYFWDTLFRLLGQLDPSKMHYMGSPAPGSGGTFFAYGGAGFVLSGGLMRRLVGDSDMALSVRYEELVKNDCCGDAILGYAIMNKTGVKLEALYPTFAGDELKGLKVDRERWCIPLLALHRVSPELMASLWTWERTRPYNEDPLYHSAILPFTHSNLRHSSMKKSWDNYAGAAQPEDSPAHYSVSTCASACASDSDCLQYSYTASTCRFGTSIQMGRPMPDTDYVSGWDTNEIKNLGFDANEKGYSTSCKEASWLKPVIR